LTVGDRVGDGAGDGADFASYVVARWPAVVRTLVLLGHPADEADAIAVEGLSRCVRDFDRERRESDVDVFVYRTVLAARAHRRPSSRPAAGATAAVLVPPTLLDLEERTARLHELGVTLAGLPEDERVAAALRLAAELDEMQVAEVLGGVPESTTRLPHDHEVVEAIPVRTAPTDEVVTLARARRRRRTTWIVAGLAAVLVVGGVATWVGTRPPPRDEPESVVTVADNPADVAWYANHVLHLDRVAVEVTGVATMVEVPDGVVYADRDGRVVLVDQQGDLTVLGHTEPGLPVVGNRERGVVGWLEVRGGGPVLVAWDTLGGRELARQEVPEDARPVALDQSSIYYNQGNQAWSWDFGTGVEPGTEPGGTLLDVSSAVRASVFSSSSLRLAQPLFDIVVTVPGTGAQLSPDGDVVLTRVDFTRPEEVRIYEAASGNQIPTGIRRKEIAIAASLGDGHQVTYVIAQRAHAPDSGDFVRLSESGPLLLRTCDLDTGACETLTQIANNDGAPVLPG